MRITNEDRIYTKFRDRPFFTFDLDFTLDGVSFKQLKEKFGNAFACDTKDGWMDFWAMDERGLVLCGFEGKPLKTRQYGEVKVWYEGNDLTEETCTIIAYQESE